MKASKVIQFLQCMSPVELNRLEKFLQSPYFNSHTETLALFQVLRKAYPDFEAQQIHKEQVFKVLFPKEKFDEKRLYTLSKYLLKLISDFWVDQEWRRKEPMRYRHLLMQVLSDRNLDKYIPRLLKESERELDESPFRDADFYFVTYRLKAFSTEFMLKQSNRSPEVGFQATMDNLDYFYLIEKLRYACAILNRKQILTEGAELKLLPEILAYCHSQRFEDAPLVRLYYLLWMLQSEAESEPYFFQLKSLLTPAKPTLPKEELANLYNFLLNYCTRKYKGGNLEFLDHMFDLYQEMLKDDLLFTHSTTANNIHFKNLVTLGLKRKDFAWTEQVIRTHKSKLDPEYADGVYSYNMANLYFSKQDYRKSLQYLQRVKFIDPFYRLIYDMLLLKTYYECGDVESLLSRCSTFDAYLRRSKDLSEANRKAHQNMARFVRKLVRVKYGGKKNLPQIKAAMGQAELLVERNWLTEKMQELEQASLKRMRS